MRFVTGSQLPTRLFASRSSTPCTVLSWELEFKQTNRKQGILHIGEKGGWEEGTNSSSNKKKVAHASSQSKKSAWLTSFCLTCFSLDDILLDILSSATADSSFL